MALLKLKTKARVQEGAQRGVAARQALPKARVEEERRDETVSAALEMSRTDGALAMEEGEALSLWQGVGAKMKWRAKLSEEVFANAAESDGIH